MVIHVDLKYYVRVDGVSTKGILTLCDITHGKIKGASKIVRAVITTKCPFADVEMDGGKKWALERKSEWRRFRIGSRTPTTDDDVSDMDESGNIQLKKRNKKNTVVDSDDDDDMAGGEDTSTDAEPARKLQEEEDKAASQEQGHDNGASDHSEKGDLNDGHLPVRNPLNGTVIQRFSSRPPSATETPRPTRISRTFSSDDDDGGDGGDGMDLGDGQFSATDAPTKTPRPTKFSHDDGGDDGDGMDLVVMMMAMMAG